MAINNFQPKIWSATLLSVLDRSLVYAGEPCSNRNYEGEITGGGSSVQITSIADPTIAPYVKDSDMSAPQALTDSAQQLLIDQAQSFNFQVDDIDRAQVRDGGALMAEAARRAGLKLRDVADKLVAGRQAAAAAKGLGVVSASTASDLYDKVLVPASVALDEADVPEEDRFVVVSPAAYGQLQKDSRFVTVNQSGTSEGLRNGRIGNAAGFTVLKSNNSPSRARSSLAGGTTNSNKVVTAAVGVFSQADVGLAITGTGIDSSTTIAKVNSDGSIELSKNATATGAQTDLAVAQAGSVVIAGSKIATTYAEQISGVEAYRPELRFGDALKGLHLYGAKVTRPSGLVVASVTI